ncbi:MAG: S26 family signal peptidase [Crocinitomicaceae bacterium]
MSFIYFYLLILLHPYLAQWHKVFPKLGRKSWEAMVPGYNYFILYKEVLNKPWWSLLLAFPGVHLVMWMTINVSLLRRFGFYNLKETLQGLFFPYLLFNQVAKNEALTYGPATNWSNSREVEIRKWGDHVVLFMALPVIGHILAIGFDKISRDKPGTKPRVKEYGDSFIWALVAAAVIRTYSFEPFQIPTGSMEKTMLVGDFLVVNKLAYGPKVPITPLSYPLVHNIVPLVNIKSYLDWEKGTYTRLPGWAKIKRNDIVVFNFPSGDTAILDPRMPGGLMGHDFHGLVNQEALFEFAIKNNVSAVWERREATPAENNLLAQFIEQHAYWKNLARERFKNGEFPVYMEESKYGQKHGGLIFRPVDKRENYIKRCVGTPGDVLEIKNSVLYVNGKRAYVSPGQALLYRIEKTKVSFPSVPEMLSRYGLENSSDGARTDFDAFNDPKYYVLNLTKQEKKKIEQDFRIRLEKVRYPQWSAQEALKATPLQKIANLDQFPKDFNVNNTMTDFQRFQIPCKGQRIAINTNNIAWYKRIISAYEGHKLAIKGDKIYIDGKRATHYRFAMNYYWMMGDNRFHSADSRVWGFVPEDHIVGRASFVWFSKSPFVDSFLGIRFDRIFRIVD